MPTRNVFRISERFEVVDQYGVRHPMTERTLYSVEEQNGGNRPRGEPALKEYEIDGRNVLPMDRGYFEMPGTGNRYRRVRSDIPLTQWEGRQSSQARAPRRAR